MYILLNGFFIEFRITGLGFVDTFYTMLSVCGLQV